MLNRVLRIDHVASTIDHIGQMQASIRELEGKLKRSKLELLSLMQTQGVNKASGNLFAATIIDKDVPRTDWKSVAAKLKPSRQLVSAHTKVMHQTYAVISARKGD